MKKFLVVYNPAAGNGAALAYIDDVENVIKKLQIPYVLKKTTKKFDAQKNIREWTENGITDIVVVGGDGTLNEVVNGLYPNLMPIRLISTGTGNDMVKCLKNHTIEELVLSEDFSKIDIFSVNDSIGVNALGLGFDGEVVKEMDEKNLKVNGIIGYMIFVLSKLFKFKAPHYQIKADGKEINGKYCITCIANGKAVGGGFFLTPDAHPSDGMLDICLIEDVPMLFRPYYMLLIMLKKHGKNKKVILKQFKNMVIESSREIMGQLDGQLITGKRFVIKLLKEKLQIVSHKH